MEGLPNIDPDIHYMGKNRLCITGSSARKSLPTEIVVGVQLRYRFNERTLRESKRSKEVITKVLNEAIKRWGDSAPVSFVEDNDLWDFEIYVLNTSLCRGNNYVLAGAFFPGGGQQKLELYPTMFEALFEDQVSTLTHELGHVFGLRHWFAKSEDADSGWTSQPFTIMNYGEKSMLTENDKKDLKLLYKLAWSGELKKINSTPIVLFKPYSAHSPNAPHPPVNKGVV
ncbi:unnamed protein product [Mortierella alpina]